MPSNNFVFILAVAEKKKLKPSNLQTAIEPNRTQNKDSENRTRGAKSYFSACKEELEPN